MINRLLSMEDVLPKVNPASPRISSMRLMLADGIELVLEGADLDVLNTVVHEGGQVLLGEATTTEGERLITPDQAGAILGVTRQTVYKWQDRNRLSRVQQGLVRGVVLQEVLDLRDQRAANATFREWVAEQPEPTATQRSGR